MLAGILGLLILTIGAVIGSGYTAHKIATRLEIRAYERLSHEDFQQFKSLLRKMQ